MWTRRAGPIRARFPGAANSVRGLLWLTWAGFLLLTADVQAPLNKALEDPLCYLASAAGQTLASIHPADPEATTQPMPIDGGEAAGLTALAFLPRTGLLFGLSGQAEASPGYLGALDLRTGKFNPRNQPPGTATGALGDLTLGDIRGLAFDPWTNALYASHGGEADVLFRLDLETGQAAPNAFGPGLDYVPFGPLPNPPTAADVDDIVIDGADGQMFGLLNRPSGGAQLIKIDKATGAIRVVGPLGLAQAGGLGLDGYGRLWVAGVQSVDAAQLVLAEVDKTTGRANGLRTLQGAGPYQALACLVAAPDLALTVGDGGLGALPGANVVYTLNYINHGNWLASEVVVTQTLPEHTTFNAAASSPGWRPAGSAYVLNAGNLAARGAASARFVVTVDEALPGDVAEIATRVVIGSDEAHGLDLNPTDNAGLDTTPIVQSAAARRAETTPGRLTLTLTPVADAYVDAATPGVNYGRAPTLRTLAEPEQVGYLRFVVQGTGGSTMARATLRIYVNGDSPRGYQVRPVADSTWDEISLTYENRPQPGGKIAVSGAHGGRRYTEMDVTSYVTGDGIYSFALTTRSDKPISYPSREALTRRPELVLEFEPGPGGQAGVVLARVEPPRAIRAATRKVFVPIEDAYVNAAHPGTNYGWKTILRTLGAPEQSSYLRFVVRGVAEGRVLQATLRLYANGSSRAGYEVYAVADNTWDEGTLTHDQRPAAGAWLGASGSHGFGAYVPVDVTHYVRGDGAYSVAITTTGGKMVSYPSQEAGSHWPELVVEVAPPV